MYYSRLVAWRCLRTVQPGPAQHAGGQGRCGTANGMVAQLGKARGGAGTNQYRARGRPAVDVPAADLLAQMPAPALQHYRCGDIWGGSCRTQVGPPRWAHDDHPDLDGRYQAAVGKTTPPEVLLALCRDPAKGVRCALAGNRNLSAAAVEKLVRDKEPDVRKYVMWNCNKQQLLAMVHDPDVSVRHQLASKKPNDPELLGLLADDSKQAVKLAVVDNWSCPVQVLDRLSRDRDESVRTSVVRRAPAGWLGRLARDASQAVRIAVAYHPECPPRLLAQLGTDSQPDVRQAAVQHPACPPETVAHIATSRGTEHQLAAAKHPNCPSGVLAVLATARDWKVREAAAANDNCPPETLAGLSRDNSKNVRGATAGNRRCPLPVLRALSRDKHPHVLWAAANNPASTPEILVALSDNHNDDVRGAVARHLNCPPETLRHALDDRKPSVVQSAAGNPACPPDALDKASQQEGISLRVIVAKNPSCPVTTLERLLGDPLPVVSGAAAANPNLPRHVLAMWQLAHS